MSVPFFAAACLPPARAHGPRRWALILAASALAGCAGTPPEWVPQSVRDAVAQFQASPHPAAPGPAPRPMLRPGDAFIFGRSTVMQVVGVETAVPGALRWRTGNVEWLASRDFFVPVLEHRYTSGATSSTIEGNPGALWPLEPGKTVAFTEQRTETLTLTGTQLRQTLRWTCTVQDARMSYVPAGDFETYRVACEARGDRVPLVLQRIQWDYAPALGHYVRREWLEGSRQREVVLSAALPAAVATPERLARTLGRLARE
ncbi:MAG: hypothetical protein MUE43_01730 [Serpentinimonas sp.]|nr:hypothetical protein [Serpentinimonas sp.]